MRTKTFLLAALAAPLLISCGGKGSGQGNLGNNDFAVRTVETSSATTTTTYPATIKGIQDVEVRPKVAGFITNVYVHEGETVHAGQVLFTLDSETYRAAVRQAAASVNTARSQMNTTKLTYENSKKLFAQKIIGQYELETSKNTYLSAVASLAQAQASLASAKEQLSYCTVVSPANGVVGSLPYKKGALVSSSITEPLTTVSDITTMEVFFSMPESTILDMTKTSGNMQAAINAMPQVKLQLADGTTYDLPGKVVKMSGVIDPQTGAVSMIAHFSNPKKLLKSGGAGQIVIPRASNSAIVIPQEACSQVQDKLFIYKVDKNNKVHYSEIKVDPQNDGNTYIVTGGLNVGDRFVSKGISKLTDGMVIKPVTEAQYQKEIDDAAKLGAQQGSASGFVKAMTGK